jgi:hypothetical protein
MIRDPDHALFCCGLSAARHTGELPAPQKQLRSRAVRFNRLDKQKERIGRKITCPFHEGLFSPARLPSP